MVVDKQFRNWWENCPLGNSLRLGDSNPEKPSGTPWSTPTVAQTHGWYFDCQDGFCTHHAQTLSLLQTPGQTWTNTLTLTSWWFHRTGSHHTLQWTDIQQTGHYIKISAQTYINKIVEHHGWQQENIANLPLVKPNDSMYQVTLELSYGPDDVKEERELKTQMGFI
jgi:hypothetical protein